MHVVLFSATVNFVSCLTTFEIERTASQLYLKLSSSLAFCDDDDEAGK